LKNSVGLVGVKRGLSGMVIPGHRKHASKRRSAEHVGGAESVSGAIDPRTLAVPKAEHTVGFSPAKRLVHLRTPQRSRGKVFIEPRLEHHVMRLEVLGSLPQLLVVSAQWRATVACNQAGGVQPSPTIEPALHQRQPHQGLDAVHEGGALIVVVHRIEAGHSACKHGHSLRFNPTQCSARAVRCRTNLSCFYINC
jgi:hypothetical protein